MQKRKSFLMKIFVLLTVVFCTFALAFGMVGCATEAVTIKSAALNANGEIVLTYSDGKTITVAGSVKGETGATGAPGADAGTLKDGCAHDFASHVVRYANCAQEGINVEVCTKCNGYKTVKTEKNPAVHGTYTTVIDAQGYVKVELTSYETPTDRDKEPTCTEDGLRCTYCAECGTELAKDVVLPKLNHKYENGDSAWEWTKGAHKDGNACMDGTYEANICKLCFAVDEKGEVDADKDGKPDGRKPVYNEPRKYHVADATWTVLDIPTETAAGKIVGVCPDCGIETEIVLPVLSAENYDVKIPTCVEARASANPAELKKVYTLNAAWVAKYGWAGEFKLDYKNTHRVIDATGASRYFEEGMAYAYTTNKDLFEAGVIVWSEGIKANCTVARNAVLKGCEDCKEDIVIKSYGEHVWKDVEGSKVEVSCDVDGTHKQECTVEGCDEEQTIIDAVKLGHKWVQDGEPVAIEGKEAVVVNVKCDNDGCDATNSFEATLVATRLGDCKTPTEKDYKYTVDGVDKIVTVTGDKPCGHKTAGGLEIYADEEYAWVDIAANESEIRWSEGKPGNCLSKRNAIITCVACGEDVVFKAQGPHTPIDKVVDGKRVEAAATCETAGYYVQVCTVEGCGEEFIIPTAAALGHEYQLVNGTEKVNANGTVTLTAKCVRCVKEITITGNKVSTTPATCEKASETVYSYKINGVNQVISIFGSEKAAHVSVNGLKVFEGQKYEIDDIKAYYGDIVWSEGKAADCLNYRNAYIVCVECQHSVVFTANGYHHDELVKNEDGSVKQVAATCEEAAYTISKCIVDGCGREVKNYQGSPLGHDWKLKDKAPAKDGKISIEVECSRCLGTQTVEGVKNEAASTPATCIAAAIVAYDYKNPDGSAAQIFVIEGEALGHNFYDEIVEWTVEVTTGGVTTTYKCKGQICKVCGALLVTSREDVTGK